MWAPAVSERAPYPLSHAHARPHPPDLSSWCLAAPPLATPPSPSTAVAPGCADASFCPDGGRTRTPSSPGGGPTRLLPRLHLLRRRPRPAAPTPPLPPAAASPGCTRASISSDGGHARLLPRLLLLP
ncbi:hypothetical protein U9M48_000274 [Paspalum notatum var. saurae]|uniref:Uncharacterized protein n=1 Tax=Paspalum notatum var. saurae TaxID=547442 RepID=A0AAQ3PHX3_PASNO